MGHHYHKDIAEGSQEFKQKTALLMILTSNWEREKREKYLLCIDVATQKSTHINET